MVARVNSLASAVLAHDHDQAAYLCFALGRLSIDLDSIASGTAEHFHKLHTGWLRSSKEAARRAAEKVAEDAPESEADWQAIFDFANARRAANASISAAKIAELAVLQRPKLMPDMLSERWIKERILEAEKLGSVTKKVSWRPRQKHR